jgi:2-hydroxy-3-keto-5-methylthiopentenyl-1-phosphate phosphatase
MDTDKSGTITLEDLRIGLTSKISDAEVQKLMEAVRSLVFSFTIR